MLNTKMLEPSKLMMVTPDGTQVELQGNIELAELDTTSIDVNPYKNTSVTEMSMTINIDNSMKLTRKKLIKLLMSKGMGRNGANEIAKYLLKKDGKYTMFDLILW